MGECGEILARELPGVRSDLPLASLTAYRVGGPAEYLYVAHSTEALRHAVVVGRQLGIAVTVLGQATNVLVADRGVRGLVVLTRNADTTLSDDLLTAGAGAVLPGLVRDLAERGLAGLEFAANIPGSVGGAVVGNAGAYGRAVSDAIVRVRLLVQDETYASAPGDLGFGYRTSALKHRPDTVVLEATFRLTPSDSGALLDGIERDAQLRRSKHPLEYATCGSYFKNPSAEMPAARLIEEAGLKGLRLGGAEVSSKHANFLVAHAGAGAAEIRHLGDEVRRRVLETSGVRLVEEVRLLGFDDAAG